MIVQRPFLVFVFFSMLTLLGHGFVRAAETDELNGLDIEELMDVEVVTASRRIEPLSQVPGAVTVLDEEDIFRSGAKTVPEVLKLVPGIHVAQVDTDKWAVGIRGFNGLLSNKHLVLLDGRPITSPSMAGVFWGNLTPVNLIKRIEVVRGTWTSLWGADSFTGVINIITKPAEETQNGKSVTMVGSSGIEQTAQLGGEVGDTGHARGYLRGGYRNGDWVTNSKDDHKSRDWQKYRGGFRADWTNAYTDGLSFQSDISYGKINDGGSTHGPIKSAHERNDRMGYAQFVWDRSTGLDAGVKLRTSFTRNTEAIGDLQGAASIVEAEVQHAVEQLDIHRVTWGVGTRYFWDDFSSGDSVGVAPDNRYTFTANSYVQDRMTLAPESLYLFMGAKLDYLGKSSLEVQPSVRLLHTGDDEEFWVAVSRAVRADNRFQRSGSYSIEHDGVTYTVNAPGDLKPENLIAYEAGYRRVFTDDARMDVSLYINDYDALIMFEFDDVAKTATLGNSLKGTAYGMETLFNWEIAPWITLQPSASVIYQRIYGALPISPGQSMPESGLGSELKLQVMTTPMEDVGFDFFVGYLDSPTEHKIPGYFSVDAHLSWQATEDVMLELIGKNLDGTKDRFSSLRVGPSLDFRMTWDF